MTTKVCASCKVEKDASAFKRSKQNGDGLYSYCRACAAEKERARRAPIREAVNAEGRAYYEANKEKVKAKFQRQMADPEKRARKIAKQQEWLEARPEKTAEYCARYRGNDPDRRRAQNLSSYENHLEKNKARMLEFQQRNLHIYAANAAKRRAAERQATPSWLTVDHLTMMKITYQMAELMSERLGEKYHVDHIHPLNGENVCGLHVPWNLQVITARDNISKSNKMMVDY